MSKEFKRVDFDSLIDVELEAEKRVQEAMNHVEDFVKDANHNSQILLSEVQSDSIFGDIISQYENRINGERSILKDKYENDILLLKEISNKNRENMIEYILKYVLGN